MLTRFLNFFRRGRVDDETRQELETHFAYIEAEELARGVDPVQARRNARLRLGNPSSYIEETREADLIAWLDDAWRDLKYAGRQFLRNLAFASSAILLLALGIGVNGAIFTVINSVILRPLPLPDPARLVAVQEIGRRYATPVSWPDFNDLRDSNHVFETTGAFMQASFVVRGATDALNVKGAKATSAYFTALGVQPFAGRIFDPSEEANAAASVALIREDFWRSAFNADPEILRHPVQVNGQATQIVGIMPAEFRFPASDSVFWMPLIPRGPQLNRGYHAIGMVGRLKPSLTVAQAQADLQVIMLRLQQQFPDQNRDRNARVVPLRDFSLRRELRDRLLALQIAALTLFLMAFANVSSLLLARYSSRRSEFDIRLALGSSRERQLRQHLTESIVLTAIGSLISIAVAAFGVKFLLWLYGAQMPRASEISPDWRLIGFIIALSIAGAIAMGLGTSFHEWRRSSGISAGSGFRTSADRGGIRTRKLLVVLQLTCAAVLLASTGAVLQSFWSLLHVDVGFDRGRLTTMRINLPAAKYKTGRDVGEHFEKLAAAAGGVPGVRQAAATSMLPVAEWGFNGSVNVEGLTVSRDFFAEYCWVTKDYMRTLGIPIVRGRQFSPEEISGRQKAAIVNQTMARQLWGDKDPLGAHISMFSPEWITVVGVARDIRQSGVNEMPSAQVFMPAEGFAVASPSWSVLVRSDLPAASIVPAIRAAIHGEEPEAAIDRVMSMNDVITETVSAQRIVAFLLICFAVLALVVSSVGLYSLLTFSVAARLPEFAIRSALGSSPGALIRLMSREGMTLVAAGLATGLIAATMLHPVLAKYLTDAGDINIGVATAVASLLLVVGAIAATIPALRVLRIDPVTILRRE